MPVTKADQIELIRRLTDDLQATIGSTCADEVRRNVELAASYIDEPILFAAKVVDEVQQFVHDERIDSTWPTCPRHGRHPVWLRMGAGGLAWFCDQDNQEVASLGELGTGVE